MPGVPLFDVIRRSPWRLPALGRAFGRMQARLHAAPLPERITRLDATRLPLDIDPPVLAEAVAASATADALCHLDFHPLNVLAVGSRITAVLDFTNAAISDRRADLGITETALVAVPQPASPLSPVFHRLRHAFRHYWEDGYRRESGAFPLTPLWQALGAAVYVREVSRSAADGRGWANAAAVDHLVRYRASRLRAAGLESS
jgi:aminoglycoside phosphotransferase (APT) family kinase protein